MAIDMYCDRCEQLIDPQINGGVRLKMGRKEYTFHLCELCQQKLRTEVKEVFLGGAAWKEA